MTGKAFDMQEYMTRGVARVVSDILKATLKNGTLKVSKHRKVAYETDNPNVATVTKSGKVKAVGKGKCTIYAYAQNGVFAKCRITVK